MANFRGYELVKFNLHAKKRKEKREDGGTGRGEEGHGDGNGRHRRRENKTFRRPFRIHADGSGRIEESGRYRE